MALLTISNDVDKKNTIAPSATAASLTSQSISASAISGEAAIKTVFGETQNTPVKDELAIGTFKLEWVANSALQVGTYSPLQMYNRVIG